MSSLKVDGTDASRVSGIIGVARSGSTDRVNCQGDLEVEGPCQVRVAAETRSC
jgi:hypothetical protein